MFALVMTQRTALILSNDNPEDRPRALCWIRDDHDGTIHKARRRTANNLFRFRQTLGNFEFGPEIATNGNFSDLDCAIGTDHANSGFS